MTNKIQNEYMIFDLLRPQQPIDENKPPRIIIDSRPRAMSSSHKPKVHHPELKKAS